MNTIYKMGTTIIHRTADLLPTSGSEAYQDGAGAEIDFKDILSCHAVLQDYLEIRESSPLYEEIRGTRRLGIPCFVREDGTMTLNLNDILE